VRLEHDAHAAPCDLAAHLEGPTQSPGNRAVVTPRSAAVSAGASVPSSTPEGVVRREQALHLAPQLLIALARVPEPGALLGGRQIDHAVEQLAHPAPPVRRHGCVPSRAASSAWSHARALTHSRRTVRTESWSRSAVSSLRPT
jgi:hypothetical protein